MASTQVFNDPARSNSVDSSSSDGRSAGGRRALAEYSLPSLPTTDGLRAPAGGLLKGATDENGQLKNAGLMVGIKLDLETEVHLTARVRGDVVIGLY